jgi:iron complex outermembrane receptor protein
LGGTLAAQINASYQSDFFFQPKNFTAHQFDGYTVADARLTWTDSDDLWSVVAFVDNFTDDDHSVIGFDVSSFYGTSQESYAKPITWGLSVRRNF